MSGGHIYGEPEPKERCPYCGTQCHADFVDNGVCMIQCGPYHCGSCHASEIGPYDEERELTEIEETTGWYKPDSQPGSSANVVFGEIVDHKTALDLYRSAYPFSATDEGRQFLRKGVKS